MKRFTYIFITLIFSQTMIAKNSIVSIVESSDINKNTFLCPESASASKAFCLGQAVQVAGFDISGGRTLIVCNNQQYWMQQKTDQEHYIMQVRNYHGDQAESMLTSQGWGAMGSYVLLITTDSILTDFLSPKIVVGANQTKVVVQLWYNGDDLIQLWSQDAIALADGKSFTINVSSALDNGLTTIIQKNKSKNSWQDNFLTTLQLQPDNRAQSTYTAAQGSPRMVRLAVV